jgi:DNA polymerase-3 subunit beta
LSNILIATDGPRLKLSATNLEIGINCWIGAKVEEEGAATVPSRLLTEFVNSLPPDHIDMELVARTQTLNLLSSHYRASIKGIDAQEFPLISSLSENHSISLDAQELREAIAQVSFAAAAEESRPVLTGVLAQFEEDRLTLAAADGFRLSVRSFRLPESLPEPTKVIIPAKALQELSRISAEAKDPIQMTIPPGRNQVLFHMANIDLVSQLVEGTFPDYNQIIPQGHVTRTVVDTEALLRSTKIAFLFARDAANILRLRVTPGSELAPGELKVVAQAAEVGDNQGEIEASVDGEPIEIAFNAKYLIDVLSVIDSPQVVLETSSPSSPGIIRPIDSDDFLHVIMPMHIAKT